MTESRKWTNVLDFKGIEGRDKRVAEENKAKKIVKNQLKMIFYLII